MRLRRPFERRGAVGIHRGPRASGIRAVGPLPRIDGTRRPSGRRVPGVRRPPSRSGTARPFGTLNEPRRRGGGRSDGATGTKPAPLSGMSGGGGILWWIAECVTPIGRHGAPAIMAEAGYCERSRRPWHQWGGKTRGPGEPAEGADRKRAIVLRSPVTNRSVRSWSARRSRRPLPRIRSVDPAPGAAIGPGIGRGDRTDAIRRRDGHASSGPPRRPSPSPALRPRKAEHQPPGRAPSRSYRMRGTVRP